MGEYDSWKPPPQKKMSSKQLLEARYGGGGSLERQESRGKMTSETINFIYNISFSGCSKPNVTTLTFLFICVELVPHLLTCVSCNKNTLMNHDHEPAELFASREVFKKSKQKIKAEGDQQQIKILKLNFSRC